MVSSVLLFIALLFLTTFCGNLLRIVMKEGRNKEKRKHIKRYLVVSLIGMVSSVGLWVLG